MLDISYVIRSFFPLIFTSVNVVIRTYVRFKVRVRARVSVGYNVG